MKDEIMRVGILGCGLIAPVHMKALQQINNCKVVSACDISRDTAVSLAHKYNISKVYTDFSTMLQKEKLDIIHVLTPPQVHAHLSIEAMEAGCHVLLEKPMCTTVLEANQMIKAAKRNNVKLSVVHSFLFNPGIRKALTAVKQGKIGNLLWVDTIVSIYPLLRWEEYMRNAWHSRLSGGVFGEIIPHGLYIQLAFLGNIRKVFAVAKKSEKESALTPFSELQAVMDCENSIGGLLMSTRIISPYTVNLVRVVGSRRVLLVSVPTATVMEIEPGSSGNGFERLLMNLRPALRLMYGSASLGTKAFFGSVKPHMTHKILIERFIESIQNDSAPPVTPEEGREVVRAENMIWKNILT